MHWLLPHGLKLFWLFCLEPFLWVRYSVFLILLMLPSLSGWSDKHLTTGGVWLDQTMPWGEPFWWHFEMQKAFTMCTWTRWQWGIHTAASWHCSVCGKPSGWNAVACTQRYWNLSMMVLPLVQLMLSPVLVAVLLGMPCPFTTQPDLCAWWIFWGH